ncbi:hypothetical protein CC2G_001803 [Coprinopsis cinerea AmutBmut pab1-1]|nr:hypothetical protein CC2G_001803 [Coprinopsis cinerea AmutBmut pab1-1]
MSSKKSKKSSSVNASKAPAISLPRQLRSQQSQSTERELRPRPAKPETSTPAPTRRSSEQVQQDRAAAHAERRTEVRQQQEAIAQAAANEHQKLRKQRADDKSASNPPLDPDVPAVKERRLRPNEPEDDDLMDVDRFGDGGSDYQDSGSNYMSDDDEIDDLSPEKRRKGEARLVMDQLKAFHDDEESEGGTKRRRSDSNATTQRPAKKAKKGFNVNAGLRNWNGSGSDHSSSMDYSSEGPSNPPTSDPVTDETNEFGDGAFSDNEEGESRERAQIKEGAKPLYRFVAKHPASARVVPPPQNNVNIKNTESVAEFMPPSSAQVLLVSRLNRSDITKSHLPQDLRNAFDNIFVPLILQDIGHGKDPWVSVEDNQIETTFANVFPTRKPLAEDPTLLTIFSKLTAEAVSQWRNKFANQATKTLESAIFEALPQGDSVSDARKTYVNWALSGKDHERVFYYRVYEEQPDDVDDAQENGAQSKKLFRAGLFQSVLISSVLSVHYASLTTLPQNRRSKEFPSAALIMAIQACKRALTFYETGEKVIPGRPYSDFSRGNWGDHEEIREGRRVMVYTTSKLYKVVSKLTEPMKKKISDAAIALLPEKRRSSATTRSAPPIANQDEDSDFDLVDDENGDN